MNENINLSKILKGHENETFYSPIYGDVHIDFGVSGDNENVLRIYPAGEFSCYLPVSPNGYHFDYPNRGEIIIFPSKNQRDWNKWIEEQKYKVPKTWSELKNTKEIANYKFYYVDVNDEDYTSEEITPIEKSAIALLKIHQLIEVGYSGNTNKGWCINVKDNKFCVYQTLYTFTPFAFHTREQAEEFLKYPENIQLFKDYFMIND